MAAALVDWAADRQVMLTASYSYQKTSGGVDFNVGQHYAAAAATNGGPLVNYVTDNTKLQRFQIKGTYNFNKNWAFDGGYAYEKYDYSDGQMAGYRSYYPYFQNSRNTRLSFEHQLVHGRVRQPELHEQPGLADGDLQVRSAAAAAGADDGRGSAAGAGRAAGSAAAAAGSAPAAGAAPQVQKITLDSKVLFDFDKAVLKPEGKAAIDSQVVGKLAQIQKLEVVLVTGHTDRLGTDAYNQKLSERRADAVRDYLVSKGVDKAKIETIGMGEKQPVVQCDQKNHEGADRVPAAQPPRGSRGQGRDDEVVAAPARPESPASRGAFSLVRGDSAQQTGAPLPSVAGVAWRRCPCMRPSRRRIDAVDRARQKRARTACYDTRYRAPCSRCRHRHFGGRPLWAISRPAATFRRVAKMPHRRILRDAARHSVALQKFPGIRRMAPAPTLS